MATAIISVERQTRRQAYELIEKLIQSRKGSVYNANTAAQMLFGLWGISVDWHVCSDILDHMRGWNGATIVEPNNKSGLTTYIIN